MAQEWKYWTVSGLMSILIIGLMTDFEFNDVEVQMHDIYFVIGPIKAIIFLTCILSIIRNFYLVLEIMTERYKIIALFVAIINPLVGLVIFILIYSGINMATGIKQMYPVRNFDVQILPISILGGLIVVQIAIQIRAIRRLSLFIRN